MPPLSGADDYIKRDGESVDVQIRAVLPIAPTQSSLYTANGLNIEIGKQVADSKAGVVARRADKAAFPSAKIANLTYTIHIAIALFDFCKELVIKSQILYRLLQGSTNFSKNLGSTSKL